MLRISPKVIKNTFIGKKWNFISKYIFEESNIANRKRKTNTQKNKQLQVYLIMENLWDIYLYYLIFNLGAQGV